MNAKEILSTLKSSGEIFFEQKRLTTFFWSIFTVGVFFSETVRALPTVGMIGLFLIACWRFNSGSLKNALKNKEVLLLTVPFFLVLIFGGLTDFQKNLDFFFQRVLIKTPYLLMPISVLFLPQLSKKHYHFILLVFVLCSLGVAIKATVYFFTNLEYVKTLYLASKTIPLPLNHVRYSLMLSLSIILSGYLWQQKTYFLHRFERWIYGGITIFLLVFIHILSVRSGLLAFYSAVLFILLYLAIRTQRYLLISFLVILGFCAPVLAYLFVPSFQNKIVNTTKDLEESHLEYAANYQSLTARVFSYKVSLDIIKKNLFFGIGPGNLEREVNKTYIELFQEIRPSARIIPHNQYIHYLVTTGFVGILFFLIGFYGLLFLRRYRQNLILCVQFLVVSLSFMVESTLETQLGANFALSFLLIPIHFILSNGKKAKIDI